MKYLDDALEFAAERAEHYSSEADPEFLKNFAAQILANAYSDCPQDFVHTLAYATSNI